MSNNQELNTDEQIARLNQKLQSMNDTHHAQTAENQASSSAAADSANEVVSAPHTFQEEQTSPYDTDEQKPLADDTNENNTKTSPAPETAEQETVPAAPDMPPSFAEKSFCLLSKIGLPVLILFTLVLCGQQFLFPRDFWFSEEVRYADIYMNMLSSGNFFSLMLNGHPYAETGPLYFVLVWLLDTVPGVNMPQAFFGASVLFAVLFVASTWILARGLGYNSKTAFLSGLIVLSMFFLAGFTNYTRMDLLFTAFLNLSYVCFFRAWQKDSAPVWLIFAFLFLCLASLTATLVAFILPFAASLFFFVWTGKFKRINSADGIIGFLLALAVVFSWFAYLYFQGNAEYINLLFEQQIIQKLFPEQTWNQEPHWYYLAGLPLALFPWVFVILFGAWGTWLKNLGKTIKNRKTENAGAWLVLLILTHIGIFSLFADKSFALLVTVLPFFAILFAKSVLNFSLLKSRIFYALLSLLTILCGIAFILFEFHAYILEFMPNLFGLPVKIPAFVEVATTNTFFGLSVMGGLFILLGVLLWYVVNRRFAGASALVFTLGIIIALQPLNILIAPQLGTVLSTKNHAAEMANARLTRNAVPASYKLYPDIFTYYYNETLDKNVYRKETVADIDNIDALTDFLLSHDTVVLALAKDEFDSLPYKNEAVLLDYRQWIENQYVVLTLWNIASHKPVLNQTEQDSLIDGSIVPESENLLNQEDKDAIMQNPKNADPAQVPQILPYLENDSPVPDSAVPAVPEQKELNAPEDEASKAQAETAQPALPETDGQAAAQNPEQNAAQNSADL